MDNETAKQHYETAKSCLEVRQVLVGINDILAVLNKAAEEMRAAGDYLDAPQLAEEYAEMAVQAEKDEKEKIYQKALKKLNYETNDEVYAKLAKEEFLQIPGYRDADQKLAECDQVIGRLLGKKCRQKAACTLGTVLVICALLAGVIYREHSVYVKHQAAKEAKAEKVLENAETDTEQGTSEDTEAVTGE